MAKQIEQYYDYLSGIYDETTLKFGRQPPQQTSEIIKRNSISNLGKVLEIGCGTGQVIEQLNSKQIDYEHYTGIDISEKMIRIAKNKFPDLSFLELDIGSSLLETVLKNSKFNCVLAIGIFEFIENPLNFIKIVKKIIDKGGIFVFTFERYISNNPLQSFKVSSTGPGIADFPTYRYTSDEIIEFLSNFFELVDSKEFIGYYKTAERIPINYTIVLARAK